MADLVYLPVCRLCEQRLPDGLRDFCAKCAADLTPDSRSTCPSCASTIGPFTSIDDGRPGCPTCRGLKLHFDAAVRLGPYEGVLRDAILRSKAWAEEDLAEALGRRWTEPALKLLRGQEPDFVVPVPLHWLRRLHRGYNQAEALAHALSETLGIPCRAGCLWRTRNTPHQTGLSVTARRENVKEAFLARPRQELQGKTILLVDDVMTTGSTCSEAAKALKRAGAGRVIAAILARSDS